MSEQPKDGGPAFPQIAELGDICRTTNGMSLRDWFAGQALAGLASSNSPGALKWLSGDTALAAYRAADAMLAAREVKL